MNKLEVLKELNTSLYLIKEATRSLYKKKTFVVIRTSTKSFDKFFKTKRGAEGYIKRTQEVSYYDENTFSMITCGSSLEVFEIKENEIVSDFNNYYFWFNMINELYCSHYTCSSDYLRVLGDAKQYITDTKLFNFVENLCNDAKNGNMNNPNEFETIIKKDQVKLEVIFTQENIIVKETPAAQNDEIEVIMNEEKNGIEIKFNCKPSKEARENLKSNGFKWSRINKVWYAKQSNETINFANTLVTPKITEETIEVKKDTLNKNKENIENKTTLSEDEKTELILKAEEYKKQIIAELAAEEQQKETIKNINNIFEIGSKYTYVNTMSLTPESYNFTLLNIENLNINNNDLIRLTIKMKKRKKENIIMLDSKNIDSIAIFKNWHDVDTYSRKELENNNIYTSTELTRADIKEIRKGNDNIDLNNLFNTEIAAEETTEVKTENKANKLKNNSISINDTTPPEDNNRKNNLNSNINTSGEKQEFKRALETPSNNIIEFKPAVIAKGMDAEQQENKNNNIIQFDNSKNKIDTHDYSFENLGTKKSQNKIKMCVCGAILKTDEEKKINICSNCKDYVHDLYIKRDLPPDILKLADKLMKEEHEKYLKNKLRD